MAKEPKVIETTSDDGRLTHRTAAVPDPAKAHLASAQANVDRMQPGNVETDETTGQRLIHPAANPQQVNPIHDAAHEAAAVKEAEILTDKESTPREKIAATEKSNAAEGAPSAIATAAHKAAVKSDREHNESVAAREEARREAAENAKK